MRGDAYIGWDLGGAHLKWARLGEDGRLVHVDQQPCRLWTGLATLDRVLDQAIADIDGARPVHAVTMTGEVADIFQSRAQGVGELLARLTVRVGDAEIQVFAGPRGLIEVSQAPEHVLEIASANWFASTGHAAQRLGRGILIDIGSTTTDIIRFSHHRVSHQGYSDGERLCTQELVYTGVSRTPVMAVVRQVPFDGEWQLVASERFATMADVYRLTGRLAESPDGMTQLDTADGAGTGPEDCARRLARMLGRDLASAPLEQWRQAAHYIARAQLGMVREALERSLSRVAAMPDLALVGAGLGRFLVPELAAQLGCPYVDFSELVEGPPALKNHGAICAPAVALAYLVRSYHAATQDPRSRLQSR